MNFSIRNQKENILTIIRKIGYNPTPYSYAQEGEFNFVRNLERNNYPRFHIYVKESPDEDGAYLFSIHLDQKRSSYKGSSFHSGEYEGELIEKEIQRIRKELD